MWKTKSIANTTDCYCLQEICATSCHFIAHLHAVETVDTSKTEMAGAKQRWLEQNIFQYSV